MTRISIILCFTLCACTTHAVGDSGPVGGDGAVEGASGAMWGIAGSGGSAGADNSTPEVDAALRDLHTQNMGEDAGIIPDPPPVDAGPIGCTSDDDCANLSGQCAAGICNESTGVCETLRAGDGLSCDDDLFCTTHDSCQGGTCQGGAPMDCAGMAGDVCTIAMCDDVIDQCAFTSRTYCDLGLGTYDCIDPDTDADNCGECGIQCDAGKVCGGGLCLDPTDPKLGAKSSCGIFGYKCPDEPGMFGDTPGVCNWACDGDTHIGYVCGHDSGSNATATCPSD